MNTKDYVVGGLATLALVIGVMGLGRTEPVNTVVERVIEKQQELGAVTGPDSYLPYIANNDFRRYASSIKMQTATTTICSFKSPSATSTLRALVARFDVSSTSASVIQIGFGTHSNATTTRLGANVAIAANTAAAVVGSTTQAIAPNTYVNVGMAGGSSGTFSPTGVCRAEFLEI